MKSQVCKLAYHLLQNTNLSQSEAMRKAWATVKLQAKMRIQEVTTFVFFKNDGSRREAVGTLHPAHLPHNKTSGRITPIDLINYFDLEKQLWRSFKAERIAVS